MGHMIVVLGTFTLFSIVVASVYIPTNSVQGFCFLHILANICCVLFDDSYSDRCEVISNCGFDLYFLD